MKERKEKKNKDKKKISTVAGSPRCFRKPWPEPLDWGYSSPRRPLPSLCQAQHFKTKLSRKQNSSPLSITLLIRT